ncbi:MAG TPA: threonine synthase [Casimicrobiaceae bacterium]|nr:threonine synthase [Casimicrobiaceae bacterium]
MNYVSTRGRMTMAAAALPFRAILLEGLAFDGGLAVPARYPRFSTAEIESLRSLEYPALALAVLSRFIDDIPQDDLKQIIDSAYTMAAFSDAAITPVSELEPGLHLLHASNGPTLAFKDVALQLLGRLFEYELAAEARTMNILGATSGDTGSSAEHAMLGKRGLRVFMLSPKDRMSPFQQAQMYSIADPAIHNLAIEGTFDDCQDIVKALSGDAAFKREHRIGAVNSINWARVAAQVVYYFRGYYAATECEGDTVQFAVPSGNFGNILAAHVAHAMGLPITRLIVATNENDVLDEFFKTGVYRPRRGNETHATSSPSMDISRASNFERYIYDVVGRDAGRLADLWGSLERDGTFDLRKTAYWPAVEASSVVSGRSTHADRVATIRDVHRRYDRIVDPHTADGIKVGRERRLPDVPLVCVETALPVKFAAIVREALGRDPDRPPAFAGLEDRPQRAHVLPADVDRVRAHVAAHAIA